MNKLLTATIIAAVVAGVTVAAAPRTAAPPSSLELANAAAAVAQASAAAASSFERKSAELQASASALASKDPRNPAKDEINKSRRDFDLKAAAANAAVTKYAEEAAAFYERAKSGN